MKEREFINPFTDFGFKRIFGQEINKDLTIDFLNLLLDGERHITDLTINNPEMQPETEAERLVVFDLYCESDDGTQFIVEMQAARQNFFLDRSLYYQSRAIVAQGEKGKDWCYDLQPVYGIFFMDFTMSECSGLRTDVALMNMKTNKVFNPKLRQIYLEMPRFTKEANECENDFERWLYLIKNMKMLKRMPFKAQRAVWDKLLEVADVASLNKDEKALYDRALKNYRDYHSVMETAQMDGHKAGWKEGHEAGLKAGLKEGREAGHKEGREEGLEEGLKQGLQEGMIKGELKKQIEIAKKLKNMGLSISAIQESTDLSKEEIQQL